MKKHFDHRNGALLCTIFFKNLFFILLLLHLTGCGFQGRKYTTGHYWESGNKNEYEKQSESGKQSERGKQSESKSESEKQSESGKQKQNRNEHLKTQLKTSSLGEQSEKTLTIREDTIKIPIYKQNILANEILKIDQDTTLTTTEKETKKKQLVQIDRARRGRNVFLGLESISALGLLLRLTSLFDFGYDPWGLWIAFFIFLMVLFLIIFTIYFLVHLIRKHKYNKERSRNP